VRAVSSSFDNANIDERLSLFDQEISQPSPRALAISPLAPVPMLGGVNSGVRCCVL
jgi:hypothetical protein